MHGADLVPIVMVLFVAMFVLTVVGFVIYLTMAGAFQALHVRPFRIAVYILLLISAMTLGVKLIQHSSESCEAVLNLDNDTEQPKVVIATPC